MMITADFMILGATQNSLRLAKRIARTGRGCLVLETRQREELETTLLEENAPIVFGLRLTSLSAATDTSDAWLLDQRGRGYLTPTLMRDAACTDCPNQAIPCLDLDLDDLQAAMDTLLSRRSLSEEVPEESLQQRMRQCATTDPASYRVATGAVDQRRFHRVA